MNVSKPITFAVVAASITLSAMAVPTLTVTKGDGSINVSVPAGAADAESKLYLVWDTEDHGDELSAWPNCIPCADALSEAAGTYTISTADLPASYCARAIVAKTVNVVDSIRLGQNSSYVNTGISATSVYGIDIKYKVSSDQTFATGTGHVLIGGQIDNANIAQWGQRIDAYMRWGTGGNTGDYGWVFNNAFSSSAETRIAVFSTDMNDLADATKEKGKAYLHDTACSSATVKGAMGTVDKTVLLSAGWSGNAKERYTDVYWYSATLYGKDGLALIDLVPAKVDDALKFYDKVSNTYIAITGNATASGDVVATDFTLASSAVMSSVTSATWTGGGETALLSDAGNWTPGLPGAFSNPVRINAPNSRPAIVPAGATAYGKFFVGDQSEGTLEQTQGAVTASAINGVIIGSGSGGIGRYTMTGGTLTTKYAGTQDDALYVGTGGGTGYFDVGGNAYASPKKLNIGTSDNSKGYMTVSDNGTVDVRGDINVGTYQNGCYGEVTQSGGIVKVTSAHMKIAYAGEGKYTLSGGKITVSPGKLYVGYGTGSHGVLKQSGGDISVKEEFFVGGPDTGAKGRGEVVLEDGSVNVGTYCMIGCYGTGSFTQSGGKITCNNWTAIGRYSGGTGSCTVTGGNFTVKDAVGLNIGEEGKGTLTVGGKGVVNAYIQIGATANSSGTLKLQDDGKIVTKSIKKGNGTATLVEFDGGTIQATTADANILQGLGNIVLKSGGVTIDTQEKNLVIKDCTFNVEPGGKITVTGGGTVTFTNCKVRYTGSLTGSVVFAETEGEFSNLPTFDGTKEMRLSEDKKTIKIVPQGFVILFR